MEISGLLGPLHKLYVFVTKKLKLSAVLVTMESLSNFLRESYCSYQLRYTNYQFTASRKHRAFKEETDPHKKHQLRLSLEEHLERGLSSLSGDIAKDIIEYFRITHKHTTKPRVGIHLVDSEGLFTPIVMRPFSESKIAKDPNDYTAFISVLENGLPYHENNLPKAIVEDKDLLHAGADLTAIRSNYKLTWRDWKLVSRFANNALGGLGQDKEWNKLAKNGSQNKNFYKSHIVIPVTFRKHADFQNLNPELISVLKLPEDGRAILGLICVDHPATYYFDNARYDSRENIDINMMYLFADALSLAIVTYLMYTEGSDSYKTHREMSCETPIEEQA